MKQITIEYKFLRLFKRKKTIYFPELWNELNRNALISGVFLLYSYFMIAPKNKQEALKATEEDRLALLPIFLDYNKKAFWNLQPYQINALLPLTEFVITAPKVINRFFIDKIKIKNKIYYAPADKFNNLTIIEFAYADTFFMNYNKAMAANNEIEAEKNRLLLIATLYREKRKDYNKQTDIDIRKDFSQIEIEHRQEFIKKLDLKLQFAIVFNFTAIRQWFAPQYPLVFPIEPKFDNTIKKTKQKANSNYNYNTFIRDLVNRNYADEKVILKTLARNVFFDLNEKIKRDTEALEQIKK